MATSVALRKNGGRVLLAGLMVVATSAFFWYRHQQGSQGEEAPLLPTSSIESQAQMITRDFRHVETQMNRTAWIIEAAVAELFQKKARLLRVKITYYGTSDKPTVITGRRAVVDLDSWDAELFGDVRAVGLGGTVLRTRKLAWNNSSKTLRAPWPVRIRGRHGELEGRRLLAKMDEKWVTIFGRVAAEFVPPAGLIGSAG